MNRTLPLTMIIVVVATFSQTLLAQDATPASQQSSGLWADARLIAAIVAAIIAALSGWIGLVLNGHWNRQEANAARDFQRRESEAARKFQREQAMAVQLFQREESGAARLFEGLRYFERGTQTRSIGLAIIESNWDIAEGRHAMWVAVLVNVAVYLIHEKENLPAHEIGNLRRVRRILERGKDLLDTDHKIQIDTALAATKHDFPSEELQAWKELIS